MSIPEPVKFKIPFADSGLKNSIPQNANNTTGKAGFDKGFPERTMLPKASGGIPPSGMDFNGILYDITSMLRYMQAGGRPTFSSELATAIGGYPKGAIVMGDDGVAIYQNATDSNMTDPNSSGAGWARIDPAGLAQLSGTLTPPAGWTDVPMHSDPTLGGPGGPLNVQAEALAARTELLKAGGGDFVQDGTGAVIRTSQDKMRDLVSVKDFGGDPVAFINYNLINDKASTFNEGLFTFATSIDLHNARKGGEINGYSRDRSVIKYTGASEFITALATDADNVYNCSLNNIKILGSGAGTAYRLNHAVYGYYEKLWIQDFAIGFRGRKAYGNKFSNLDIWDCSDTGILLDGDNNNAITFDSSQVNNCGKGISLTGCYQVGFTNSIIEKCASGLFAQGLNFKVSFTGGYAENNAIAFHVYGGTDLAIRDNLIKCSDTQTAFKPVNSNTSSVLELTIEGNHIRDNSPNNNVTFIDLTDVAGTDVVRIRIKDNLLRTYYAGSIVTPFKSGGVAVNPDPKHIEYSDFACLTVSTPTADVGTLTINTPLRFYPEEGGLMRLTGNVTVNTTATLTGQNQVRITLPDVRYAAKVNQAIPVYSSAADPGAATQGTITLRTDGKMTIASVAAINGLTFEINLLYSRLYAPS